MAGLVALIAAAPASAADPLDPVGEGVREQSCKALAASTTGLPDYYAADEGRVPPQWERAEDPSLPDRVDLRTESETFNRLYEFALRSGRIYVRTRGGGDPWRELPVPLCFANRVDSISVDDDELLALDRARRIYTMDGALKDGAGFNWTSRWGTPFWTGLGYNLPATKVWAWSVISVVEDGTWTDPAGNQTEVGAGKVSHIWGLRRGGRRITFWDPWFASDESYEMCGPHRGRFRSAGLSASGSEVAVIGRRGDIFTRLYDFDISGHDPVFFSYSYEDQRGKGDGAPIQLPAEPWTEQPKIPGQITNAISVHKRGKATIHRIVRVEGKRRGRKGFWQRDVAWPRSKPWRFRATGTPLQGKRLRNPSRDSSAARLARGDNGRYRMREGGLTRTLTNFNVYCSPATLVVRGGRSKRVFKLHHVDGLRQHARGRGLDSNPRTQEGQIEGPPGVFEPVTVTASQGEVVVEEKGWRFARLPR